jgi:adenylate kinase
MVASGWLSRTPPRLHPGRLSRAPGPGDWLDERLAAIRQSLPVVAVSIQVDYTQLLRRITGRRNCPVCGTIYNVYLQAPEGEGFCDLEGAALVQRSDDTEECFRSGCAPMKA